VSLLCCAFIPTEMILTIHIIVIVLKAWNHLFRKGKINLLPSQILEKIDGYLSKSNCFEPNIATYTIILDGASHCPNPAERIEFTEALLVRLITESSKNPELRPTSVTFSAVINAFARSGSDDAAERAEKLLELAQTMHNDGWIGAEPNAVMYTSVIKAWAKAGNPDRAELLLKRMYEDYTLNGNTNVKPNIWSFNTVLAAWSKGSPTGAVESAEKLLRKMIDLNEQGVLDSRPDTVSYNCLLHTLARKRKSFPEASVKAESLVEEMLEIAKTTRDEAVLPNEITFTALFKILNSCGPVDKADRAKYWAEKIQDKRILDDPFVANQLEQLGWTGNRKRS
jgi:pentatricopeptide repeat protein